MLRTEPHEIDARAQRVFQYVMPGNIAVRPQTADDYGIDAEVELFVDGRSTGTIFKVQLKGQKALDISVDGATISYSFPVRKGIYLIEQVEIPTVFILVDVTREAVYWCDIHGNKGLLASYFDAKANNRESFTIHFRAERTLPLTLDKLLEAVVLSADHIALRRVSRIEPPNYLDFVSDLVTIENELSHLNQKVEIASAEKLRIHIEAREYDEAESLIETTLVNPERSYEAKFDAILQKERVFVGRYGAQRGDTTKADYDVALADELTELAEVSQNERLRLLARAFTTAARLFFLVNQDMQLFHNWRVHHDSSGHPLPSANDTPLWLHLLAVERTRVTRAVLDTYEEFGGQISTLISEAWGAVPDLVTRAIFSLSIFLLRLKEEGLTENASYIREVIGGLIDFVAAATNHISQGRVRDAIFDKCVIAYEMQLTAYHDDAEQRHSIRELAQEMVEHIADVQMRKTTGERFAARFSKAATSSSDVDWDAFADYYRRQAKLFGIDLSLADKDIVDPRHPQYLAAQIARIVDLGIRDLNPTRILNTCKHLIYDFTGGIGEPAMVLRLPSARMKIMGCSKHLEHGAIAGYSLDTLFAQFQSQYCSACPHRESQDSSWVYTTQWHTWRIEQWKQAQAQYRKRTQA